MILGVKNSSAWDKDGADGSGDSFLGSDGKLDMEDASEEGVDDEEVAEHPFTRSERMERIVDLSFARMVFRDCKFERRDFSSSSPGRRED